MQTKVHCLTQIEVGAVRGQYSSAMHTADSPSFSETHMLFEAFVDEIFEIFFRWLQLLHWEHKAEDMRPERQTHCPITTVNLF